MDPKIASVVSNALRNIFKTRMPNPRLPALEPKPLLSFGQVAKLPFKPHVAPPEPGPTQIHPDALEHQLARNHDKAWGDWAESGDETATHQVAREQALNVAKREMDYPALQPKQVGTNSVRNAMNEAYGRLQARNGAKPPHLPPELPEPRIIPRQPKMEELGTEPPTDQTFVSRYMNPELVRPHFNPAQRFMRFLGAKPGTPGFDHSTPLQNLVQLGAQKAPWGALGAAAAGTGAAQALTQPKAAQ